MSDQNKPKEIKKESCKYQFTAEEKAELASALAQGVAELREKEDDKKAVMSDFKAAIDTLSAQTHGIAGKLNNGFEMRQIECEVVRDYPKHEIRYIRIDTDECVRTKKMSQEDMEMELPLE